MGGQVNDISNSASQTGIDVANGTPGAGVDYTATRPSLGIAYQAQGSTNQPQGNTNQVHGITGVGYTADGQVRGFVSDSQATDPFVGRYAHPAPPTEPRFNPSHSSQISSPPGQSSVTHLHSYSAVASIQAQAEIPQSQSYHSMPTLQPLLSPGPTPQHLNGSYGHGIVSETSGRLTEPRNYAPRTSGQPIINSPPPKFGLEMTPRSTHNNKHDPFFSPSSAKAVIPYPVAGGLASSTPQGSLVKTDTPVTQRSLELMTLTNTPSGYPIVEVAMSPANFPFVDGPRQARSQNYGVVKLKNIPFATKRSEIIAFLGRNSKILNDSEEPVHIIMERATSKTMDAYVEFHTLADAMKAAERHHQNAANGRVNRLGDRPVEVELSSQASLMKDLFPVARGIFWDGPQPSFKPRNRATPWDNFKGFISTEEMTMLIKHVEVPHRSPFSKECPQRPYECLISTLRKFPWHMTEHITINQRTAIYKATCELIRLLTRAIDKEDDIVNLNTQLFKRVITATMNCHGFTTLMKDDFACMVDMNDAQAVSFGQPRFANSWTHQYALIPKPGIRLDVVEWYIAIIREQTQRDVHARPLTDRTVLEERAKHTSPYWGYFWAEVGYTQGPQFDSMTLAQCAHAELSAVERILSRALPRH